MSKTTLLMDLLGRKRKRRVEEDRGQIAVAAARVSGHADLLAGGR